MRQWSRATLAAWLRDGSLDLPAHHLFCRTAKSSYIAAMQAAREGRFDVTRPGAASTSCRRDRVRWRSATGPSAWARTIRVWGICAARPGTASSGTSASSRRTARPSDLFAAAALSVSASLTGPADSRATVAIADMAHLNGIDLDNHAFGANCYLKGKLCAQTLCVLSR